jgi:hypothetical protein
VGNGFTVPPADRPTFPTLVANQRPTASEAQLLAVVQEVQRRRGRPAPATLPGLFAAAECFVAALPELDPYRPVRKEPQLGPLETLGGPLPDAPAGYFAYLSLDVPQIDGVLNGLARSGFPGAVYLRGADAGPRDRLRGQGLNVLDGPTPLGEMLAKVSAVVHHGGVGVAQHALAAGRPQLIFPEHLEHVLYGQLLQQLGAGAAWSGGVAPDGVARALQLVLSDPRLTRQSREAARAIQARGQANSLPRIVDRCFALAAAR